MKARAEQPVRPLDTVDSPTNIHGEGLNVHGGAVRQEPFRLGPDEFVRVKVRRIGGEPVDVESRMAMKEGGDEGAAMNGAAIPQEDNRSRQVAQEVTQEADDLHPGDVVAREIDVETEVPMPGRDREGGDGGDPVVLRAMPQDRGATAGRPGFAHRGEEQEAAFIEKRPMGPERAGFFLYGSRPSVSTAPPPSRCAREHAVPGPAMSTPPLA